MKKGTNKKIIFSIVIPTHNRVRLLQRAIKSILAQTFDQYEIVIVDDASTDDTHKVIKNIPDRRLVFIKLKKRSGAAKARNMGVAKSKGDFLAFLDSDDEAYSKWLEQSFNKIKTLPQSWAVLYPKYDYFDSGTQIMISRKIKPLEGNIYEELMRKGGLTFGGSGAIVRKKAFIEIGGFDEKLLGFHDVDLWYRISKNWTFHYIGLPLVRVHEHKDTRLTSDYPIRQKALELFYDKWSNEIMKYAGISAIKRRQEKYFQGIIISRVRDDIGMIGKYGALKMLLSYTLKNRFEMSFILKILIIIIMGRKFYYHLVSMREKIFRPLGN